MHRIVARVNHHARKVGLALTGVSVRADPRRGRAQTETRAALPRIVRLNFNLARRVATKIGFVEIGVSVRTERSPDYVTI